MILRPRAAATSNRTDPFAPGINELAAPPATDFSLDDELRRRVLAILGDELERQNPIPMQILLGHLLVELTPDELMRVLTEWLKAKHRDRLNPAD